jgi:hypothetical protein
MEPIKKPGGETRQELNTCKDKDFQPIERDCSLKKLSEIYVKSFDEFCQGFPKGTPTQYLFKLHDIFFTSKHMKNEGGRLRWKV